jgi:hypothetical protein
MHIEYNSKMLETFFLIMNMDSHQKIRILFLSNTAYHLLRLHSERK